MRSAPAFEVRPIRPIRPDGVLSFRLVDELGGPVRNVRQGADFGVRGTVGKDQIGGHGKWRLSLDTI